jgi:NitT/TauT family transport system substrate-binding protein
MLKFIRHAAVAGLLAATVLAVTAPAQAQTKITGGVAVNFEGMLAVITAKEEGFLKAAGIELEFIDFKGGAPTVQAFVGGSVDMCFCAGDHVVRLRNHNMDVVVLYGLDDRHNYTLIGKKDAPTGLAALKGKPVGMTSSGSMTDNTLRWAISGLKMDPQSDYQLVPSGTGASMVAAIESGKVAAGMVVSTDREFLLTKRNMKIVEDFTKIPYAGFSTLVKESWIKANPKAAHDYVDALNKAVAALKKEPALGKKVIKTMFPTFDDAMAEFAAKEAISRIPEHGMFSAEAVKNLNEIMVSADPTLKPITLDEMKPKL